MDLIKEFEKNRNIASLFSEFIIVDWYDGMVTGAAKLVNTDKWYLCDLCYFKPGNNVERIYSLIEASEQQSLLLRTCSEDGRPISNESLSKVESDYKRFQRLFRKSISDES